MRTRIATNKSLSNRFASYRFKSAVVIAAIVLTMAGGSASPEQKLDLAFDGNIFFGGSGNQRGTGISIVGDGLFVSGITDANGYDGLVVRYPLNSPNPVWSKIWPALAVDDNFFGVAATGEGVYLTGDSYGRTSDTVGDKEGKGVVVKFPPTGPIGGGFGGATWDKQTPAPPGAFSYGGYERLLGIAVATEAGQTYVYATGYSQSGFFNSGRLYLSKLDANGTILWTRNDGSSQVGNSYSVGRAVTTLNGNILVAGQNDDNGSSQAYLRKYDSAGNLVFSKVSNPGGPATYQGIAAFGGSIYAVGVRTNGVGGSDDFLIEKWDEAGNLLWSRQSDRNSAEDRLNGVVGLNSKIYAVGSTKGNTAGERDAVVVEIDPASGNTLATMLHGGANDDIATGAATDGKALYVVGESRSFASAEGNTVGENDLMVLVFIAEPPILKITMNKATYVNGEAVTATGFLLQNPGSTQAKVELAVWLEIPGVDPMSILKLGADSSFILPANFSHELGPIMLFTVDTSFPRGNYAFNSRMVNPVTEKLLSEDLNAFLIQ